MIKYKRMPKGFKRVYRGKIKSGDIVRYCAGDMEDCVGLIGLSIKVTSPIYRKKK